MRIWQNDDPYVTRADGRVCLGVEAGATRTVAIAAGGEREPIRREFGPANLWLLDDGQLMRRLTSIARVMPRPVAVAIGMAGARTDADHARIRRAAARVWPRVPCHATSDLETALMAAPEDDAGVTRVLVVSGTGSCCFGRRADGRTARFGGWGHLLGDRASAYDIAMRALRAVVHASDGGGDVPRVGHRILRALVLNEPENLVGWTQAAGKADVAALAPEVFAASDEGDRLARAIVIEAADSLARDAEACARLLERPRAPVRFLLAGSVLLRQPRFAALVGARIRRAWRRGTVSSLDVEGAWGAVALAWHLAGNAAPAAPRAVAVSRPVPAGTTSLQSLRQSPTEQRNPRSLRLDRLSLSDAVTLMLEEDRYVRSGLLAERAAIVRGVRLVVDAFRRGGRLFYAGAGTSGRLGVLDASECPPTFRTPPDMVQGIMAGGQRALWSAVEGAEDDGAAGERAVVSRGVGPGDVLVGIAASGRTPFVWGALGAARRRGAAAVLLCFNPHLRIPRRERPTLVIAADVGPEILTGSTRLKAGTATKLVLNLFTTLAMVRMGKVRSNLMIDLNASNVKLRDRALRIVQEVTGADAEAARAALERASWRVREASDAIAAARGRRRAP